MTSNSRRYRPIVERIFSAGSCTIRCAQPAQKRVRKMVINEKHIYEREQSPFSSRYRLNISATEELVTFSLTDRLTGDNFIADALTLPNSPCTKAGVSTEVIDFPNKNWGIEE